MSCPFYGKCALPLARAVVPQGGNQCALVLTAFSPCVMEVDEKKAPDWPTCPRNTAYSQHSAAQIQEWERDMQASKKLFEFKYPD